MSECERESVCVYVEVCKTLGGEKDGLQGPEMHNYTCNYRCVRFESHIFISEHFVHIVYSILKIIYVLYMRFESHLFHFCLSPVAFNTTERQRWAKEKN